MTWNESLPLLIPAGIALAVCIASHQLAAWRDRVNKRREQRVAFLIESFRSLSRASNHPRLYEVASDFERAIADIQFLGSLEQIEAAQLVADSMLQNNEASLDPLLFALRSELRKELGREPYAGKIMWVRIEKNRVPHKP